MSLNHRGLTGGRGSVLALNRIELKIDSDNAFDLAGHDFSQLQETRAVGQGT